MILIHAFVPRKRKPDGVDYDGEVCLNKTITALRYQGENKESDKMKKRITSLALALVLCLGLAVPAAAEEEDKFPAVSAYPGYGDVQEEDWFYDNAKLCYEIGIMTGTDKGFEADKALTGPECAVLAARLLEGLTGRAIPAPGTDPGKPWYQNYIDYLGGFVQESGSSLYGLIKWYDLAEFEKPASRYDFLVFMALAADGNEDYFPDVNHITYADLPDVGNDQMVLSFYNRGILTGKDRYGTFDGAGTLNRAEAAAMVSRMAKSELRKSFVPADYSPFAAACLTPDTVMFSNGVTAEAFLAAVNGEIAKIEESCALLGMEFNWHYDWTDGGDTTLYCVRTRALESLAVTEEMGTQAYKDFDYQVYYSRLIDRTGGPLGAQH